MKIKVLLITQWFDPEPTFKGLLFAKALVEKGFEVEVLTGFPNYPAGKIYDSFKIKLIDKKIIDGVTITRVPLYPSHNNSVIKRAFNYLSYALSATIYGVFFAKKPNIIYSYHPPITVGIAASLIKIFRRVPLIYDIQDLWPDTLKATNMITNDKVIKYIGKICDWVYRSATHLVVLSPGFKKLLIERGVPESKIEVIYNWADEAKIENSVGVAPAALIAAENFNIVFAGNIGKAQALDTVIESAAILQKKKSNIQFVIVGGGVCLDGLTKAAKSRHLKNIVFIPSMPMNEIGATLAAADVLLVHLNNDPLFEITIPSKTQAYMAAGKPILMGVKGDAADLIKAADCGLIFEPQSTAQLVEAAENFLLKSNNELVAMGENAKNYYKSHLSIDVGVSKFAKIFVEKAKIAT